MLAVPELGVMLPMAKSLIRSLDWNPDIHCTCIEPYEPSLMRVAIADPVTRHKTDIEVNTDPVTRHKTDIEVNIS